MTAGLRVLTPSVRPDRPLPRWTIPVLGAGLLLSGASRWSGTLELIALPVWILASCVLAGWAEERLWVRFLPRPLPVRLAATAASAASVLILSMVLALGIALIGRQLLGNLSDPFGALSLSVLVAGVWFTSAACGTMDVTLIDAGVSAGIRSFRGRLTFAILGLLLATLLLTAGAAAFAMDIANDVWVTGTDLTEGGVMRFNLVVAREGSKPIPAGAVPLLELFHGNQQSVVLAVTGFTALISLPALMSASAKLAESAMDRIHPLRAGFDALSTGERDIRVEEKGSDDFIQLGRSFNRMVVALEEAERMEKAFGVYVSAQVLDRIRAQHGSAEIPASLRDATVFFCDIRGFTAMSEKLAPDRVVALLNRWFERVVAVVQTHDGYLNKFIGDAVVVVFNGPIDQPDHAERAARCAVALQQEAERLNSEGAFPEIGELRIGVGVATGAMVCGNVGGSRQMEYTVIGDTVNLASRLTSRASHGEVLVAEATAHSSGLPFTALDPVQVKGKEQPVVPCRIWPAPIGAPGS